jgi:hypothetical protein
MSSDFDNLDMLPCNQLLEGVAAQAQQVGLPIAPRPMFFSGSSCGTAVGSRQFPQPFVPISCNPAEASKPEDNCLRVLTRETYDALKDAVLQPWQYNVLPTPLANSTTFPKTNNLMTESLLLSWYVPPHCTVIFFAEDPGLKSPSTILSSLQTSRNFVMVNSCRTNISTTTGDSFLEHRVGIPIPQLLSCDILTDPNNPPNREFFFNGAAYFVVIQEQDFNSLIFDMCANNRDVLVGNASLKRVWFPQSSGCDQFMTSLCSTLSHTDPKHVAACSCFVQQKKLDEQFGASLAVPVCCFGEDDSGDVSKSCAFNSAAYKTAKMLSNCCSFAECENIVQNSALGNATDNINISCQGQLVDFPRKPASVDHAAALDSFANELRVPHWVWSIFITAAVFMFLFVIGLAFI